MFEDLNKEMKEERKDWYKPLKWGTPELRSSAGYVKEMERIAVNREMKDDAVIEGEQDVRQRFFNEALRAYPRVYWMEGCAAPTVNDFALSLSRIAEPCKPNLSTSALTTSVASNFTSKTTSG